MHLLFLIIIYTFVYFVIGGIIFRLIQYIDKDEFLFEYVAPIAYIIFWPVLVVVALLFLIIGGAAYVGSLVVDFFFDNSKSEDKQKTAEK